MTILWHLPPKSNNNNSTKFPIETNDNIITDSQEKAEIFNNLFLVASHLDDTNANLPDIHRIYDNGNNLNEIEPTINDVKGQIDCLDCSKSYGPDGVSPVLIKKVETYLVLCYKTVFIVTVKGKIP